jgi:opacity protein-like surface antigen
MKSIVHCLAATCLLASVSLAEEASSSGWNYKLTPYAWAANLDGTIGIGPAELTIEEDFGDIVKNISMAAMVRGEAHNGTFGFYADMVFIELSEDYNVTTGKAELELDQWMVTLGGLYRVADSSSLQADVGAGVRLFDTSIDLSVPGFGKASRSADWVDPVITARARMPVATKCFVLLDGEIGGFGVESDLVWQLTAATGYHLTDNIDFLLAYRYLDYDYDQDMLVYDLATSGLALGLTINF